MNGETTLLVDGSCFRVILPAVFVHRGHVFALAETVKGGLRLEAATGVETSQGVPLEITAKTG